MKSLKTTWLLAGIGILSLSCQNSDKTETATINGPGNTIVPEQYAELMSFSESQVTYTPEDNPDLAEVKRFADDHNRFAFQMFRKLRNADKNLAFSPLSIRTVFATLYPATEAGQTPATEFATGFAFDADFDQNSSLLKSGLDGLANSMSPTSLEDDPAQYKLVNQLWVDESLEADPDYLDHIKGYYNAGVGSLPFRTQTELSREAVNSFVAVNTEDLIKDLLPEGSIKENTISVLTNSVYFKAQWQYAFNQNLTSPSSFQSLAGETKSVEMMSQQESFEFAETDTEQALSLDYRNAKIAMIYIQPKDAANYLSWEDEFDQEDFSALLEAKSSAETKVSVPKLDMEWGSQSIKDTLKTMGIERVFDRDANHFPNLFTEESQATLGSVFIDDVFHKTKLIVDESGTEAAAATGIVIGTESAPTEVKTFSVDRPTLFAIYDKVSASILFMGRIADPSQK
ncbi:MAG: serpin family protein [Pseudobacteriovorax sp.]|nr:serpin family protein [Pseudobacteriovorax sp.]